MTDVCIGVKGPDQNGLNLKRIKSTVFRTESNQTQNAITQTTSRAMDRENY